MKKLENCIKSSRHDGREAKPLCMGHRICGKPVYLVDTPPWNDDSGFVHKLLSSGYTFTAGTSCVFRCTYCYVESMVLKQAAVIGILADAGLPFDRVVIRRVDAPRRLAEELTRRATRDDRECLVERLLSAEQCEKWGLDEAQRAVKYWGNPFKGKVVFGSPLVDIAATPELAAETVEMCEVLLRLTSFDLRLLSKSPYLASIVAKGLAERLPVETKKRVIFGLSTGTLDDHLAPAIEPVPLPSERLAALHQLQDEGFRTFGMLCPILPQEDAAAFAKQAMQAIRADLCEDLWGEPVNFRARRTGAESKGGDDVRQRNSFEATLAGLRRRDGAAAERFLAVAEDDAAWEQYCRDLFGALHAEAPKRSDGTTKLHWMQYPRNFDSVRYWDLQKSKGALALGSIVSMYRNRRFQEQAVGRGATDERSRSGEEGYHST
jgi:DNA repair photolyase